MNKETTAAVKASATTALLGSAILMTVGNPVAWAALTVATIQVGRTAYRNAKLNSKRYHDDQDRVV
jgi:hypothetical protein|tara:strand:+ start:6292 stop:6489 length:198 start_codon:yes stop_codon:yes gene_type:complete